jgi:glutamyl-tRNA reductase
VICSTDAPHTIVRCDEVGRALAERPGRPLVLIDLAVPRDVDPEVASMSGALLYDIDDVECSMHESYDARRGALDEAETIVAGEVEHFQAVRAALAASPTLDALHRRAEHIRRRELDRLSEELDPEQLDLLDAVTRSLVTKLLHEPSVRLREAGSLRHTGSLHHLFALEDEEARTEPLRAAV